MESTRDERASLTDWPVAGAGAGHTIPFVLVCSRCEPQVWRDTMGSPQSRPLGELQLRWWQRVIRNLWLADGYLQY